MLSYQGVVFAIEPPLFVELVVTIQSLDLRGTATGATKPAVETVQHHVPLFVEQGDVISTDTRNMNI